MARTQHAYTRLAAPMVIIAALCAFGTVTCCYYLTMTDPSRFVDPNSQRQPSPTDIQPGVFVPCISFLGTSGAPRLIYRIGFGATAVLMALCIHLSFQVIGPHLLAKGSGISGAELGTCVNMGYVAAAGVFLQGVFTLSADMGPSCFVHWAGAAIFAGGAQSHAAKAIELYDRAIMAKQSPALCSRQISHALAWRKQCLGAPARLPAMMPLAFVFTLLSQAVRPQAEGKAADAGVASAAVQNGMGAMQWAVVGAFVLYFASYSVDVVCCADYMDAQDVEDDVLGSEQPSLAKKDA